MPRPLPYQINRPIPAKLYVCEAGKLPIAGRLAGPFDTDVEAQAAAGAIEAEHACYHTEVWICPVPEPEATPIPPLLVSPADSPYPVTS